MAVQSITALVSPGLNHLYIYQRDTGAVVSGLIFGGEIRMSPRPVCPFVTVVGTPYCTPSVANSSGTLGDLQGVGSSIAADNALELLCTGLPPHQLALLLASRDVAQIPHPGGSQGTLCLGAGLVRFAGQLQSSGPHGELLLRPDLLDVPTQPRSRVMAGDVWHFQVWHRDVNPGPTSNFTGATTVRFD